MAKEGNAHTQLKRNLVAKLEVLGCDRLDDILDVRVSINRQAELLALFDVVVLTARHVEKLILVRLE